MTFADKILDFHRQLDSHWQLPEGITLLYPFDQAATWAVMTAFFKKYYDDHRSRILVLGINPGRFGAGITGTPFTDPVKLEEICGIPNDFQKRVELSADFVYEFIEAFGGAALFYQYFYITSVCPLGFVKEGKNYNYYDDKALQRAVEPHIIHNIQQQLNYGCRREVAFTLGKGKNYQYLRKLNEKKHFFDKIIPLPHPRWVMQYRRKQMEHFRDDIVAKLQGAIEREHR